MAKVTGIGGVFFKSKKDPKKLADWYSKNLGIKIEPWGGGMLKWPEDKAEDKGITVWCPAPKNTKWFKPGTASFMINYRVDNMKALLTKLKRNRVTVLQGPECHENGKFAWILDLEGNKVELWEPMLWDEKNKKP